MNKKLIEQIKRYLSKKWINYKTVSEQYLISILYGSDISFEYSITEIADIVRFLKSEKD